MKAVITAGGEGSRLRPLTPTIPKPLAPVLGVPVLDYAARLLSRYEIREIAVTLREGSQSRAIIARLDAVFPDLNFYYFIEGRPLGTAGGVKNAEKFLDETFIVVSGDVFCEFNIEKMLSFHRANGADVTLAAGEAPDISRCGAICRDSVGRVFDFCEKPSGDVFFKRGGLGGESAETDGGRKDEGGNGNTSPASCGVYIIEPDILRHIPPGVPFDFGRDLFPNLLGRGARLFAFEDGGFWRDVGDFEGLFEANMYAAGRAGGRFVGDGCYIDPAARIGENTVICDGASVFGDCDLSDCLLLEGAEIRDCGRVSRRVFGRDFSVAVSRSARAGGVNRRVDPAALIPAEDCAAHEKIINFGDYVRTEFPFAD